MTSDATAERLALALGDAGMQRMTARVLAAFLFSEQRSLTAGDLGGQLGASAGSISASITMLRTVSLIEQTPVPGSRRSHYRMRDDAWSTLMSSQNPMLTLMLDIADDGLASVAPDGPAAARLHRMREFYAFMLAELPALIERFRRSRPGGG